MVEQIVTTIVIAAISSVSAYFFGLYRSTLTLHKGVQALLRNDMLMSYERFKKRGCSLDEKQNFCNMYDCYHELGKNGVMTAVYNNVLKMQEGESE